MSDRDGEPHKTTGFISRCLSLDLEVGRRDARIYQFAAVRGDSGQALTRGKGELLAALPRLDGFAAGLSLLLGHNLDGMTCVDARVTAILVRRREDADEQYQQQLRNDQWEVVLPELVFNTKQPAYC